MAEKDYTVLEDEALITLLRGGDEQAEEALYDRYKPVVRARARAYFLVGADHEDLIQEGMIGLYRAVLDFVPGKQAAFSTFADLCIRRHLITAVTTATRKKHMPLNTYVSFSRPLNEDGSEGTVGDLLSSGSASDPEEMLIAAENYEALIRDINTELSKLEKQCLDLYMEGKSYQEIADRLGRTTKAVDNAIQRIKKKLEKRLKG